MNKDTLIKAAQEARKNAYAPYSHYNVGAAALDEHGNIHAGCNIENASYGATVCAERVAIFKLIAAGAKQVKALALVTANAAPPCGICLQVLSELDNGDTEILCAGDNGEEKRYTLAELLSHPFKL